MKTTIIYTSQGNRLGTAEVTSYANHEQTVLDAGRELFRRILDEHTKVGKTIGAFERTEIVTEQEPEITYNIAHLDK